MAIRENIQKLMDARGVESVYALAHRCGLNQPTLQRIMSGETKEPSAPTLKKVADYFGVTIDDLRADRDGRDWATMTTERFAALTPEALDLLAAFQRLAPERQEAYLHFMFMEVFMNEHMPWLKQGRPQKESYEAFERRMVAMAPAHKAKK